MSRPFAPSAFRDFHAASSLARGVERQKPATGVTAADRAALADSGKRYGAGSYDLPLPVSNPTPKATLEAALNARRSTRDFADRPVPFARIGALLGAYRRSGALDVPGGSLALRTAASAGGLYPIEVYLVATRVSGLTAGVYHYRPAEAAIAATRTDRGDVPAALESLLLEPEQASRAAGAVMLTARFDRSTDKYGDRGYRYVLIEAGEVVQTLALGAAATETGMVCHGAFYDDLANQMLGIDGLTESVVVILLFGALQEKPRLEEWRPDRSAHT
jgi:SagB-type dehydrogenase family enzyme